MAYLSESQLQALGFKRLGRNVRLSDKASIYNPANIEIDDHARIDDFCVVSAGDGGLSIGRYVHVAVYCSLMGGGRIEMHDFSGLSSRVSVYSSNDDYSGNYMTNPAVPAAYTHVTHAPVVIEKHVIIGAGSIILPGVTIGRGTAVGALSLIKGDCEPHSVYFGCPAKRIGKRASGMFELEEKLAASLPHD